MEGLMGLEQLVFGPFKPGAHSLLGHARLHPFALPSGGQAAVSLFIQSVSQGPKKGRISLGYPRSQGQTLSLCPSGHLLDSAPCSAEGKPV